MSQPLTISDLSDAVWSGSDAGTWQIEIYELDGDTLLGTYQNEDTYVDGDDGEYIGIYLKFIEDDQCTWTEYTDTLTLSHDGDDVIIRFPASAGISHNDVLYVDSNGFLYTDAALTTPAVDWVNIIPEETITPSDAISMATESISDTIIPSDAILMATESIEDEINVSDEFSLVVIELNDTVNIEDKIHDVNGSGFTEQTRGNQSSSWTETEGGVS